MKMMAKELDPSTAWKGDNPSHGLRSRYTGCPLNPGEMVVTILSQGSFSAGHQVIVFEWGHGYGGSDCYRKHKAFHLYPERGSSVNELGFVGSATSVVPGRIERLRRTTVVDGQKKSAKPSEGHHGRNYAEQELSASNGDFMKGAKYKSWLVPFDDGNRAFLAAKEEWKFADKTPKFNLLGFRGDNCGTWVQRIASIAGINPNSFSAKMGFPVPVWEVHDGQEIKSEEEMWKNRA